LNNPENHRSNTSNSRLNEKFDNMVPTAGSSSGISSSYQQSVKCDANSITHHPGSAAAIGDLVSMPSAFAPHASTSAAAAAQQHCYSFLNQENIGPAADQQYHVLAGNVAGHHYDPMTGAAAAAAVMQSSHLAYPYPTGT
jgi:hypothetical protein